MDGVALPNVHSPVLRRHHASHWVFWRVVVVGIFVGALFFVQPHPSLSSLDASGVQSLTQPATFTLRIPVARTVRVRVEPHIEGEISYVQPLFGNRLYRSVVFTPSVTWQPGTTYRLTLLDVESALPGGQRLAETSFSFTTAPATKVVRIDPSNETVLNADSAFRVSVDRPVDATASFLFRTQPEIPLHAVLSEDRLTYVVTPAQLLPQGQSVQLQVVRTQQRLHFGTTDVAEQVPAEEPIALEWRVRTAAGVDVFQPQGVNQLLTAPIAVTLSEPTDLEVFTKGVALAPPVEGEWSTADNRTFTLTHVPLVQRTTYTLKLANTLRTQAGGFLPENVESQFSTIGPVLLRSSTPADNAAGVLVGSKIRVTFDQPVDHASAGTRFRISPATSGKSSWDGNTFTFTPAQALAFDTTYTISFTKGVAGTAGFASAEDFTVRFTTEHATTRLAVPFHRQEHKLSCEVATLVMALRYRGVDIGEQTLIDAIGFDPTVKKGGIWGDPNVAFVGDIDGQQPGTGYGVYAAPIAKAGSTYRKTRAFTSGNLAELLTEVKAGNPVIVWGNAASGRRVDWKTPTGKNILAIVGEHTRVVIGFTGTASNPVSIITLDPLFGEKHFTRAAFLADWALLGNMGVVVE